MGWEGVLRAERRGALFEEEVESPAFRFLVVPWLRDLASLLVFVAVSFALELFCAWVRSSALETFSG